MSETIILSVKHNTFKFVNEFDSNDTSYYIIDAIIEEKLYSDNKTYYDISYEYEFKGSASSKRKMHPFYSSDPEEDGVGSSGVIIFKNTMTEIMVEYLLHTSEELEKLSGTNTSQCYRTAIMVNLSKLWD